GKEFESTRYNQLDDMVSTVGNAFLGLTIGCARCHDHKFDPIATRDYYRMVATFATAIRSDIELDLSTPEQRQSAKADWTGRVSALHDKIEAFERDKLEKKFAEQIARVKKSTGAMEGEWSVLEFPDVHTA